MLEHKDDDDLIPPTSGDTDGDVPQGEELSNSGTLIIDATCIPVNIRHPQDISLLNEAREKLENFFNRGYAPADKKDSPLLMTIFRLYMQQEYMYRNRVHSVANHIVSIRQLWVRPHRQGESQCASGIRVEAGCQYG